MKGSSSQNKKKGRWALGVRATEQRRMMMIMIYLPPSSEFYKHLEYDMAVVRSYRNMPTCFSMVRSLSVSQSPPPLLRTMWRYERIWIKRRRRAAPKITCWSGCQRSSGFCLNVSSLISRSPSWR